MEPTKRLLELKELRFSSSGFEPQFGRRLIVFSDRLSRLFLSSLNTRLSLLNTNVIHVIFVNTDFHEEDPIIYRLGEEQSGWIGSIQSPLSESTLKVKSDDERRNLLLWLINDVLMKFTKETGHDTVLLEQAYKQCLSGDFYYNSYREYQSKNKKYTCQIQSRENWGSADYRLFVKNNETDQVKTYNIAKKDYPFFDEMPGITQEEVFNYPQTFYPIKWEEKNFVMYWGKERYVFGPVTEQLIREE